MVCSARDWLRSGGHREPQRFRLRRAAALPFELYVVTVCLFVYTRVTVLKGAASDSIRVCAAQSWDYLSQGRVSTAALPAPWHSSRDSKSPPNPPALFWERRPTGDEVNTGEHGARVCRSPGANAGACSVPASVGRQTSVLA